ncbi:hypothetical protein [Streptomyces sp. NPDC023327]|uniref:hypothetical protein n=1 Tax=Streptomyces sp. NPDC023327 TaxID=3157088 RepID=UPI0033CC4EB8
MDLTREASEALTAMPDDVHEDVLARIDFLAAEREIGDGPIETADAVLQGRCWIV